ncbi:TetR/AcrR family transcriptional regulator [Saccharopolyspora kobensis]|uniref:TetR/AcrR family transcriptional regulator n=1 Tax=Saccharopolyspora kobensis TaxID=146035 RepID=UPI000B84526E|nr:TetR/AcrR family transcriptional regulator [Saccharopolyspora kobensis]
MSSNDEAPAARSPGRPRSAEVDEAILDAAIDLLVEQGVGQVSIKQVAQRAGVTRDAVYRRFPDLTALLVRAVEWEYRDAEPVEWPDLDSMIAGLAGQLSRPRDRKLFRRLYAAVDDFPALLHAYAEAHGRRRVEAALAALARAQRLGQLPPHADPVVLQQVLAGAAVHYVSVTPDDSGEEAIRAYFAEVLQQVGYRPASEGEHGDE